MKSVFYEAWTVETPAAKVARLLDMKSAGGSRTEKHTDRVLKLADPVHPVRVWLANRAQFDPRGAVWREELWTDWLSFWRTFEWGQWFDLVDAKMGRNRFIRALTSISCPDPTGMPDRYPQIVLTRAWHSGLKRAEPIIRGIRLTSSIY